MVDTFAHGLFSYLTVGRSKKTPKSKRVKYAWLSVFFGMFPDLMSWTIYLIYNLFNGSFGRPNLDTVPEWVMILYGISHSIFIFGAVILAVYLIKKSIPVYLWAWGLHILVDVPTHSRDFLPTPFLWPISDWAFPGISWGRLVPYYWAILLIWVGYVIYQDRKHKKSKAASK